MIPNNHIHIALIILRENRSIWIKKRKHLFFCFSGPDVTKKALIQMGNVAPGASLTASNLLYNPTLRNTPSPVPPPRMSAKAQEPPRPAAPAYQRKFSSALFIKSQQPKEMAITFSKRCGASLFEKQNLMILVFFFQS